MTLLFAIPARSPPPSPAHQALGPPIYCSWPPRGPDSFIQWAERGESCRERREGSLTGPPTASRGLDLVEASPRPPFTEGLAEPGLRRRAGLGGAEGSPGTGEGGDEEAGASSGRVGPRPDCPHAPLHTSPQRAHRKLRPAGRGVPPSYPPLPAILANEKARFVTRPALRPRDPAADVSAQSKQASRVRAPPFSAVGSCRVGPTPCCRTLGFSAGRAETPRAESRESSCVYTLSPVCVLFV